MKTKEILIKLVEELAVFEKSTDDITFENFVEYINQKHTIKNYNSKVLHREVKVNELNPFENDTNRDITVLITFMFKYAKNYLKKALENTIINTPDEFGFLITMLGNVSFTKTELINKLVTEKTSGVETIKRLIKRGLLEEFKTLDDKKSVHVKITDFGRENIITILPTINKVTKIITGNLTEDEKLLLTNLLVKLDAFHNDIYFNDKIASIESIYANKLKQ